VVKKFFDAELKNIDGESKTEFLKKKKNLI